MDHRVSYLSDNVKKLIFYRPNGVLSQKECYNNLFLENGVLNWNAIEKIINLNECISNDGVFNYIMAVSRLHPISCQVHTSILQLTMKEFRLKYENNLDWTTKSEQLLQCFNLLKKPQPTYLMASLLLLASTLERLLGDIFLTYSDKTVACPSLLKDLLKTEELRKILGDSFMCCLEVFIGSPRGLNLRNLAWHGFLSENELPKHYVSFLLMLTISLAEAANALNEQLHFEKLNERQLIKYSENAVVKDVFANIEITGDLVNKLFSRSYFVTSSMVSLWYLASDFFEQKMYNYFVMLMLPQLEHSLRRLYTTVNEMPERVKTAESAEFYTTFNEILSPELADGSPNKLIQFLESCHIELLLDILVHPEGPRLRDHLSHGEVELFHFPEYLAKHLFCIAVAFCLRFQCPENVSGTGNFLGKDGFPEKTGLSENDEFSEKDGFPGTDGFSKKEVFSGKDDFSEKEGFSGKEGFSEKDSFLRKNDVLEINHFLCISRSAQDYRSIFHPFSCFRRECSTLIDSLREWPNLTQPNEDEFQENFSEAFFSRTDWERITSTLFQQTGVSELRYTSQDERSIREQEFVLKKMVPLLEKRQMDTLFRPRYELEKASILRQVVGNCLQASNQIQLTSKARYNEWERKTLRSRQRNNYKRFWLYLPAIGQTLTLLTVVIISEFININKMTAADARKNKFFRKCLQCSENLASLSSPSRNRWLECNEVCKTWLDQISSFFNGWNS